MKTFISGSMSSDFDAEAARLTLLGHTVVNPCDLKYPSDDFAACMAVALAELRTCDAISMLPGWEFRPGCVIEYDAAVRLGLRVYFPKPCAALSAHIERAAAMEVALKMLAVAMAVDRCDELMRHCGVGRAEVVG